MNRPEATPMVIAVDEFGESNLSGWWIGLITGFGLVVVVVLIVGALLALAAQIGERARHAANSLRCTQLVTQPITELGRVNDILLSILHGAKSAREALESQR
jgi:hypothetical protein